MLLYVWLCVWGIFRCCSSIIWMVLLMVYGWSLAGWSLAGWCLGAARHGMACCKLSQYGSIFDLCVAAARKATIHINTQYQTILHTCHQWHLQLFSCPDWRSLVKEKAACVACWKVNKCKSLSKNWKTAKPILHVPAKVTFFLRVLHLTEWLKVFCKFFCILWQPASQSGSYICIEEWNYSACSASSICS